MSQARVSSSYAKVQKGKFTVLDPISLKISFVLPLDGRQTRVTFPYTFGKDTPTGIVDELIQAKYILNVPEIKTYYINFLTKVIRDATQRLDQYLDKILKTTLKENSSSSSRKGGKSRRRRKTRGRKGRKTRRRKTRGRKSRRKRRKTRGRKGRRRRRK